jgi:hypothetical protein
MGLQYRQCDMMYTVHAQNLVFCRTFLCGSFLNGLTDSVICCIHKPVHRQKTKKNKKTWKSNSVTLSSPLPVTVENVQCTAISVVEIEHSAA